MTRHTGSCKVSGRGRALLRGARASLSLKTARAERVSRKGGGRDGEGGGPSRGRQDRGDAVAQHATGGAQATLPNLVAQAEGKSGDTRREENGRREHRIAGGRKAEREGRGAPREGTETASGEGGPRKQTGSTGGGGEPRRRRRRRRGSRGGGASSPPSPALRRCRPHTASRARRRTPTAAPPPPPPQTTRDSPTAHGCPLLVRSPAGSSLALHRSSREMPFGTPLH
ncbi:unnamed protein product [Lota lota]